MIRFGIEVYDRPYAEGLEARQRGQMRMAQMVFRRVVQPAMQSAEALATQLVGELDPILWSHASNDPDAADLRDYVVGVSRGVARNLQNMAVHFKAYAEVRYAQDRESAMLLSTTGVPYPREPGGRYAERDAELAASEQGAYVALGSTLDCLAGMLVGLAGLKTSPIRADFGMLLSKVEFTEYPEADKRLVKMLVVGGQGLRDQQISAMRSLMTAVDQAGPANWAAWAVAMRNMLTHREHRTEMITFERTKAKGHTVYRLPPRDPSVSNMQGMRAGRSQIQQFFLFEDNLSIHEGLANSLSAAVVGTVEVLRGVWAWRQRHPLDRVPVVDQWSQPRGFEPFEGFGSPVPSTVLKDAFIMMNPIEAERMRAAKVLKNLPTSDT